MSALGSFARLPRRIAALPVRAYRRWITPFKPPTCRFHPTCSAYALEALELHGLWRGLALSAWRLLRCQPLCKGGFDPVPGSRRHGPPSSACDSAPDVDTPATHAVSADPPLRTRR
ncbi:MAG TPA: membrane protein insertion efficiency factor YidD [Planctomycetota bacterium]|nr:membrane protein insertion efficiency factor YidD [Planctomycetota bacterium]